MPITGCGFDRRKFRRLSWICRRRWKGRPRAAPISITKWIGVLAKELNANKGKSIVIAGPNQPAAVHAPLLCAEPAPWRHQAKTLAFTKPVYETANTGVAALRSLVGEINGGQVKQLVILGGNPAFTSPYDLHVGDAIKKVDTSIFVGADPNETWPVRQVVAAGSALSGMLGRRGLALPDRNAFGPAADDRPALRRQVAG